MVEYSRFKSLFEFILKEFDFGKFEIELSEDTTVSDVYGTTEYSLYDRKVIFYIKTLYVNSTRCNYLQKIMRKIIRHEYRHVKQIEKIKEISFINILQNDEAKKYLEIDAENYSNNIENDLTDVIKNIESQVIAHY